MSLHLPSPMHNASCIVTRSMNLPTGLLMRLHVLNGDRATALRIYHTCVTLLQQELGVEPSAETQQLYQRLLNMPVTPGGAAKRYHASRTAYAVASGTTPGVEDSTKCLAQSCRMALPIVC